MSQFPNVNVRSTRLDYATDEKVMFNFFNTVYAWMAVGLAVTAVVAWFGSTQPAVLKVVYGSTFGYIAMVLGAALIARTATKAALNISATAATGLFLLYAAVIGFLLSGIFLVYSSAVLFSSFIVTAGVFGGMSVFGFITKRDLTKMGSIVIMCVWGLFIATIVNMIWYNDLFSWILTYGILAAFILLTAYDTQKLKAIALATQGDKNLASRYAIIGSLNLYVDFLNMFMSILRIMGSRR